MIENQTSIKTPLRNAHGEDPPGFYQIQTATGWRRVLEAFAAWCQPKPGWSTLDVGSGPGYLAFLFAQLSCRATAVDLEPMFFLPKRLHAQAAAADGLRLPFASWTFDMVSASNVVFLQPDPEPMLDELARCLKPGGRLALINPSEHLSVRSATALADERGLSGADRESLIAWAQRAEANHRWSESELAEFLASARLRPVMNRLIMGPGLARFSLAAKDFT